VERCSYLVWPPNEGRVSFGGFLLTDLYPIPTSYFTLPLRRAPLFAKGLPIPKSASGLGFDGQANLWNGAICFLPGPAR
jgi:hypothetical protein